MKNKTTHKPNITVYVGRSERSDLRHLILHSVEKRPLTSHLTFCRSDLLVAIIRVGWSEQSDPRHLILHSVEKRPPTSHLTFCRSDLLVAIIRVGRSEQSDPRQIAKKDTKNNYFLPQKTAKKLSSTTHILSHTLTSYQQHQKDTRDVAKQHRLVSFTKEINP